MSPDNFMHSSDVVSNSFENTSFESRNVSDPQLCDSGNPRACTMYGMLVFTYDFGPATQESVMLQTVEIGVHRDFSLFGNGANDGHELHSSIPFTWDTKPEGHGLQLVLMWIWSAYVPSRHS